MTANASPGRRTLDALRRTAHALHGTRSLTAAIVTLLVLAVLENLIPAGPWRAAVTLPALVFLVLGLLTLAREGVAVQDRVQHAIAVPGGTAQLARHLVLPALLVVLLLPQVFLGAFGVPHFSPLTGLIPLELQGRLAVLYMFILLWLPVLALRRTRPFAPDVEVMDPYGLEEDDPRRRRRLLLLGGLVIVAFVWAVILHGFWRPFSILEWPPGTDSLEGGVSSLARFAFVVVLAACLFVRGSAYMHAVTYLIQHGRWRAHPGSTAMVVLHVLLVLTAAVLHLYDLMWIVNYQLAARF